MLNTGTRGIPLKLAEELSAIVNASWDNGEFINKVSPITADLLKFWFDDNWTSQRDKKFHSGQRQAILNAIYCHEILKTKNVADIYSLISQNSNEDFVDDAFINEIQKQKFSYPKYCIKMATGTGKTWVLNALLIWQYLNAIIGNGEIADQARNDEGHNSPFPKRGGSEADGDFAVAISAEGEIAGQARNDESGESVKWTKNFLIVAPGLIVYERLLDAFKGKQKEGGLRDFNTSDIKNNEDLFLPEKYRQAIYSFIQNSVLEKHEISKKTTGGGIIAITNWHLFVDINKETNQNQEIISSNFSFANTKQLAQEILPIPPGKTEGNYLSNLDGKYFNGGELKYLSDLPNICVFNDEAHHIHENKTYGITDEVEWQKALNEISKGKNNNFLQIDFSATPYNTTGSGNKRTKHYFAHIIVDFDLRTAMLQGLIKSFALDRRKEIAALENKDIEFKAIREGKKVVGISDGQRIMLRAGLSKLKILEKDFERFGKPPKMLIVCEDTQVSPFVIDFLKSEGLDDEDIMQIDSNAKGDVTETQWVAIKQKLFNIDKLTKPKVIVSVLMLREGFDVNNICVIVPLRSNEAPILLEQVLGRGLRLMWRESDFTDIKTENRKNIYELKKAPPSLYDILYVVEHPAFEKFYEDLDKSIVHIDDGKNPPPVLGDIINIGLKENYTDYDLFFPEIIKDKEEFLREPQDFYGLKSFENFSLEQLKAMAPKDNDEHFVSFEPQVQTTWGQYRVSCDRFNASSYNDYLIKILSIVSENSIKISERGHRSMPLMQINQATLMELIDRFIRHNLFAKEFDPLLDNNWRILMISKTKIVEHILKEISQALYEMQNDVDVKDAKIHKHWFSQISEIKIREKYSLDIVKSIYEKTNYPSNKGEFEKDFLLAADADSEVERLIKINEHKHFFARFKYIRLDGLLSSYFPDFMVKIKNDIYIVETKSTKDAKGDLNVKQKQKGALDYIYKINELRDEDKMNSTWHYVLIDDTSFYALHNQNASIKEIFDRYLLTKGTINAELDL
jgi:type III restriction enzyme